MQYQVNFRWTLRLNHFFALLFLCLLPVAAVHAQVGNAKCGQSLYTTVLSAGKLTCSNAQCHGVTPGPLNKLKPAGSTDASIRAGIAKGIGPGGPNDMTFLTPILTAQNIADLAAYVFNPAAATGTCGAVATPTAALSPTAVSFGSSTVGIAATTQTVTVSNSGTAALVLSGISTGSTEFVAAGGTCTASSSIAAAGSCTVILSFTPSAAGARSATLTVSHNATPTSSTVGLSGTGVAVVVTAPVAQVGPASLSFGSATVGSAAFPTQTITVNNTGTAPLVLSSISTANTQFVVSAGTCTASSSIAPAGNCTIIVTFTPNAAGARAATLTVSHNATGGSSTVALSGTGTAVVVTAPIAQLTPTSLNFASANVGAASVTQIVTVSNSGNAPLVLSGIATASTEFTLSGGTCTASSSIAPTGNCTIIVTFTPNAAGARSATLTVSHNATGGSASIALSGTGTAVVVVSPAVAQINPAALTFAATAIATTTSGQAVTVSNTGGVALTLGATSVTGANSGEFSIAFSSCAASLVIAPGASCVISMTFTPSVVGARSATLSISHNASGSPGSVSLTGTGTPAVVVTNPTKVMTEYRYVPLNYFFITSRDGDKAVLDTLANWERTGQSFTVYVSQVANSQGINRFYFDKVAMANVRGSHFYTLLGAEIVLLQGLNPANTAAPKLPFDEAVDSYAMLPVVEGVGGSCAAGQVPVYRLFRGNVRFPDDPNHRFTTSAAIYDEFVKLGWDGEGVKLCVPAQ